MQRTSLYNGKHVRGIRADPKLAAILRFPPPPWRRHRSQPPLRPGARLADLSCRELESACLPALLGPWLRLIALLLGAADVIWASETHNK